MKKSVFREKYAVKEEKPVAVVAEKVPVSDENEKSSILEVGTIKVSRRKKGDE